MKEPEYYKQNGLSPIGAFKQGLMSKEQYKGFLIGNVIKYVVRAGHKDNAIQDLNKAKNYIDFYLELLQGAPDVQFTLNVDNDIDIEEFKKQVMHEIETLNNGDGIIEVPTEDEHIIEVKLS